MLKQLFTAVVASVGLCSCREPVQHFSPAASILGAPIVPRGWLSAENVSLVSDLDVVVDIEDGTVMGKYANSRLCSKAEKLPAFKKLSVPHIAPRGFWPNSDFELDIESARRTRLVLAERAPELDAVWLVDCPAGSGILYATDDYRHGEN